MTVATRIKEPLIEVEAEITPKMLSQLQQLAAESGATVERLAGTAVARFLDDELVYWQRVEEGIASLERGEGRSHDEVMRRVQARLDAMAR